MDTSPRKLYDPLIYFASKESLPPFSRRMRDTMARMRITCESRIVLAPTSTRTFDVVERLPRIQPKANWQCSTFKRWRLARKLTLLGKLSSWLFQPIVLVRPERQLQHNEHCMPGHTSRTYVNSGKRLCEYWSITVDLMPAANDTDRHRQRL